MEGCFLCDFSFSSRSFWCFWRIVKCTNKVRRLWGVYASNVSYIIKLSSCLVLWAHIAYISAVSNFYFICLLYLCFWRFHSYLYKCLFKLNLKWVFVLKKTDFPSTTNIPIHNWWMCDVVNTNYSMLGFVLIFWCLSGSVCMLLWVART